jgi:hypothetical protein
MYRCWYEDPDGQRRSVDWNKGVWPCEAGFWVDKDWNLTIELDACLHWIPPGRIVLLTKLPKASGEPA